MEMTPYGKFTGSYVWFGTLILISVIIALQLNLFVAAVSLIPTFPSIQLNALHDLYVSTNGNKWVWVDPDDPLGVPWNFTVPNPNPCIDNWQGVTCNRECIIGVKDAYCEVLELDLHSHHLNGTLPDSLAEITSLQLLDLADNGIIGYIPISWGKLINMTSLDVSGNLGLGGTLPDMFQQWNQLLTLDLSRDQFYGILPLSLYTLSTLEYLDISINSFNGTITTNICDMINLQYLYFDENNFYGTIPSCISNLIQLKDLVLSKNHLTYSIPHSITLLTSLETFDVSENRMYSEIPNNITNLLNLTIFSIQGNLFEGRIPDEIYKLTKLDIFTVASNLLIGKVPNISTSVALSLYSIEYNFFFGSIHHLNMSRMLGLITEHNYLTGLLPPYINETRKVISMDVVNQVAQYAPIISRQELQAAVIFISQSDNFTGNLFFYTNVSANYLTGPIPTWVLTSPILTYVYMFSNMLTGTIPDVSAHLFNVSESLLGILYLDANYLTGIIPSSIIKQRNLKNVRLASNNLIGTIPTELFQNNHGMVAFEVENNQFSGTLPNIMNMRLNHLRILSFGNNRLTGSIYNNFTFMPSLTVFAINTNCFTGTIPDSLCHLPFLSELIMDGLSASPECRQKIFPFISSFTSFILKHGIDGTIPKCLYEMPIMASLYLSGNLLGGTIPSDVNISDSLINLRLSYNSLTGSIPSVIQQKPWHILDLSYNRLNGHLEKELFDDNHIWRPDGDDMIMDMEAVEESQALYLDVNRLSGNIPASVKALGTVAILNENLFYCDLTRDQLPKQDPKYRTYSCASDALYQALLGWLLFWLVILLALALLKYQIGNVYQKAYLPIREAMREWDRVFELADHKLSDLLKRSNMSKLYMNSLSHVFSIAKRFFHMLRMFSLGISGICIFIFMPTYRILNIYQSVFENKYAWEYSAIYMGGIPAGIVLFVVFSSMLIAAFVRYHKRFQALIVENYERNGGDRTARDWRSTSSGIIVTTKSTIDSNISTLSLSTPTGRSQSVDTLIRDSEETDDYSEERGFKSTLYTMTRTSITSMRSAFSGFRSSHWSWFNFIAIGGLDCICMTFVNIVYVIILVYVNQRSVTILAQIILAMFKVWWNEVFIWHLVKAGKLLFADYRRYILMWKEKIVGWADRNHTQTNAATTTNSSRQQGNLLHTAYTTPDVSAHRTTDALSAMSPSFIKKDKHNKSDKDDSSELNSSDIFLIVCCLLFNNIIAPSLGVSIVSPACFYNAFYAAGSISSTYIYCTTYIFANSPTGVTCTQATASTTTFSPPFIYSYSCSSLLPVNYVTVYLYMLLISGFIMPTSRILTKYVYDYYLQKDGVWHKHLGKILPFSLVELYPDPENLPPRHRVVNTLVSDGNSVSEATASSNTTVILMKVKPLFDKNRFVVRCIGFLTLLISYGVVFPPLGFVAALAVVSVTLYEEYNIGRILFQAERVGYSWYLLKVAQDFEGIAESFVTAVFPMGMVACLLFASLIFDTFGTVRGAKFALVPASITVILPVFIWILVQTNWQRLWEQTLGKKEKMQSEKDRKVSKNGLEMRKSNAASLMSGSGNPMHRECEDGGDAEIR